MTTLSPVDFLFKADGQGSLAKANKFSVTITPPGTMDSGVQQDQVQFLCHSAELPGKQFSTVEDRIYGVEVMKPYAVSYEPVSLTFYNTNDFSPKKFWEDWIEHIQPRGSRNMRYYNDIVGSVQIYHYHETADATVPGKHNYVCTLNEAWPLSIGELEMNWENQEFAEFQVSIQYRDWTKKGASPPASSGSSSSTADPTTLAGQYASYGRGNQSQTTG